MKITFRAVPFGVFFDAPFTFIGLATFQAPLPISAAPPSFISILRENMNSRGSMKSSSDRASVKQLRFHGTHPAGMQISRGFQRSEVCGELTNRQEERKN
jgi:hypothetical protein